MNSSIIGNIASRGLEAMLPETLRDLKKSFWYLLLCIKRTPLQLIILKHKTVFYTYQKTVHWKIENQILDSFTR
jgi:hypothetical protein